MTGLIVALDTTDVELARRWACAVRPHGCLIKLGLEFFLANGPQGVCAISPWPFFLDLKLHDIPNTVARAVRAVLPLAPRMLTLHASGGEKMIAAARQAAETAGDARPRLLAVTVLTSLSTDPDRVLQLAGMALAAGADGLVCSGHEIALLRNAFGKTPLLVVPGIRPSGAATDDQARTMTPRDAAAAGADWLVVGRPITQAADPGAAAEAIAGAMAQAATMPAAPAKVGP